MAQTDEIDDRKLPQFSAIKAHEKLAVQLHAEGVAYETIVNTINSEYNLSYKISTVREWFHVGEKLEAAYLEYLDFLADESVRQAKLRIKRLSEKAVTRLEELLDDKDTADNIVERVARTVLNKYIPDRQIIVDENKEDSLPGAIADAGDAALGAGDDPAVEGDDILAAAVDDPVAVPDDKPAEGVEDGIAAEPPDDKPADR